MALPPYVSGIVSRIAAQVITDTETTIQPLVDSASSSATAAAMHDALIQALSVGIFYDSVANGLAGTVDGQVFNVWSGGRWYNYLNNAGVAVLQNEMLTAAYANAQVGTSVASAAALAGLTVDSSVSVVTLTGYYSAGDGGGHLRKRGTSSDIGAIQSADGAWWAYVPINGYQISPRHLGAKGDGTTNDTTAMQNAVAMAVALGGGTVLLGANNYRVTAPIGTLLTTPIAIIGDGTKQSAIWADTTLSGDVLSFRNCWYGAESVVDTTGATVGGNPTLGVKWPTVGALKSAVHLEGFRVVGDRSTSNTQNGIIFYDSNDAVVMRDVEVQFIRGIGICLSGMASNLATNSATLLREAAVDHCQTRWCGDWATGRPSVMFTCNSRSSAQGGVSAGDDANNYNFINGLKIVFPEGVGLQCNCLNINTNQASNNRVQVIVDSQRGPPATPTTIPGGFIPSGYCSISAGVLTITAGASFTKNDGSGTGSLSVGTYVFNANVPPGTYISAITSGPGSDGSGVYQLANRQYNVSGLTVAATGSCRFTTPMIEIGGGRNGEDWEITANSSGTLGSNGTGVVYTRNPLNASTPATAFSRLKASIGRMDQGFIFTVVQTLAVQLLIRAPTVPITVGTITSAVTIDVGGVVAGGQIAINGSMQALHVNPGMQRVHADTAIGTFMDPNKWPNCAITLNNSGTLTRWVSVPQSPNYNTCVWTAA